MSDKYSTLRQGLYEALITPMKNSGVAPTPAQTKRTEEQVTTTKSKQ